LGLLLALLLAAAPEANLSLLRPASGSDGLMGVEGARPPSDPDEPLQLQLGFDASYKPVRLGPRARSTPGWEDGRSSRRGSTTSSPSSRSFR